MWRSRLISIGLASLLIQFFVADNEANAANIDENKGRKIAEYISQPPRTAFKEELGLTISIGKEPEENV